MEYYPTFVDGLGSVNVAEEYSIIANGLAKIYPYYVHATFGIPDSANIVIHGCRITNDNCIELKAYNLNTNNPLNTSSFLVRVIFMYYII